MPCPTCAPGPHRHQCPACDRHQPPPHLGGDPLELSEPCRNCLICLGPQVGIPIPPPPGAEGRTAARLNALGLAWDHIGALVYPGAPLDLAARRAEIAAERYRRGEG